MKRRLKAAFFLGLTVTRRQFIGALCFTAAIVGVAPVGAQQPDALAVARRLADAGAPQLALDRVLRDQPRDRNAPGWNDWEAIRCRTLSALGRQADVIERAAAVPTDARAEPLSSCLAAGARAAAALQRYGDARRYAARVLWQYKPSTGQTQALRQIVIDSYVGERRGDEAFRAMLRYQQDYQPVPRAVLGRFVTALLELRMDREALTWLPQLDDNQPAKLALRMRTGVVTRDAALSQARAALASGGDPDYWRVILEAARDGDSAALRIAAYEQLLNVAEKAKAATHSAARRLWDDYLAAAEDIANRQRLLVGDDANWADYAGRRLGTEPQISRAFFAHLSQHARSASSRQNAQLQLLYSLETDRLGLVALRLFEEVLTDIDALDRPFRYRLGAMAEAGRRAQFAARLWRDLPPPPDVDAADWRLRVARQQWRADGQDTGVDPLVREYATRHAVSPSVVQSALVYAAELADAGQHASARRLLEALAPHADPALSRTILFRLGSALEAAGELKLAADAYLRAALPSSGGIDAAALQARLRAGLALARIGYSEDARSQLEWLIANGKDPSQLEAARNALKQL